jgi:hypothetical protein
MDPFTGGLFQEDWTRRVIAMKEFEPKMNHAAQGRRTCNGSGG